MKLLNKLGVLLLCCMMSISCASTLQREGSINPSIENIYLSSVTIKDCSGKSYGSGTIIHNGVGQRMFILTAAHVVAAVQGNKKKTCVSTAYDSILRPVGVYKIDPKIDLALLYGKKKETKKGPAVKISLYAPNIGDSVRVIGTPLGSDRTVTDGIVSNFETMEGIDLYRTTAATYYGNSGGGMFNSKGELIGVAHAILEARRTMFTTQVVPGGFFFVSLKTIRTFM